MIFSENKIKYLLTEHNYKTKWFKSNEWIVIHYTANPESTAKSNCEYFASKYVGSSANYFVDWTDEPWWCCVKPEDVAWHCGGSANSQGEGGSTFNGLCTNSNSIGVEMCCHTTDGKYHDGGDKWFFDKETVENTIGLVKYLMNVYNIDINHIIRHYDITSKNCPSPFVLNNTTYTWELFKSKLVLDYGWKQDGDNWHYYDELNGIQIKNNWVLSNGEWYYIDENGNMVKGWKDIGKYRYYFSSFGNMVKDWKLIDNKWYYFHPTNDNKIGALYVSDENGAQYVKELN